VASAVPATPSARAWVCSRETTGPLRLAIAVLLLAHLEASAATGDGAAGGAAVRGVDAPALTQRRLGAGVGEGGDRAGPQRQCQGQDYAAIDRAARCRCTLHLGTLRLGTRGHRGLALADVRGLDSATRSGRAPACFCVQRRRVSLGSGLASPALRDP
jgi:hypothetical protein